MSIGDLVNDHGVANTDSSALLRASSQLTGGSVADISSKENAETAVTLLATAVSKLSAIQTDVGKGQNQLQFVIGLATTQITNLSAAESRIRDADLAAEAANLDSSRYSAAGRRGCTGASQLRATSRSGTATRIIYPPSPRIFSTRPVITGRVFFYP